MSPIDKFKNLPSADEDTKILFQNLRKLGSFDILLDTWCWEGFTASSIIFYTKDIVHLSKDTIIDLVKKSDFIESKSEITFRETEEGYTFVNFNFHHEDMD